MYKETLVNRKRPVSKKKGAAAAEKERAAREKDQEEDGKEPEDKWELVCLTREDWIEFPKEFADSEHTNDRRLVQYIEENVLPKVMEVLEVGSGQFYEMVAGMTHSPHSDLQDLEEEKKKKEALEHARRSTRVQAKELHKTEQEKQDALKRAKEDEEAQKYADGEKAKHEKEKNTAQSRAERAKERENKLMQLMIEEKEREEREEKERTRLERIERLQQHGSRRQPGEKPKPDEDDDDIWWFCCGCGEQGWCYDDGSEMIECDSCRVWQHTGCLGVKSALYQGKEFLCPACGGGKRPRKAQRATVTETLSDHYEEDDLEGQLEVVAPPRKRGRPRTRIAPSASPPPASTATTAKASTVAPKPKRPVVSIPTDGLRPKNAAAGMFPTGGQNGLAIPPQFRPGPRPGGFAFMPPPGMMPPNFHGIAGQPGMMPSLYPMGQSWVAATQGQPGTMYPSGPIMMAPGMHMFPQMAYGVPGHFPPGFRPLQPSMPPGQQPQTAPGPIR